MTQPVIHWFRNDLRLHDNPALQEAGRRGPLLCIYIRDDAAAGTWAPGGASQWWLHHSLEQLQKSLMQRGGTLLYAQGDAGLVLRQVARQYNAAAVYYNHVHEPWASQQAAKVDSVLADICDTQGFAAQLLNEPGDVLNKQGTAFQVFTPYYRCVLQNHPPALPVGAPGDLQFVRADVIENLADWRLLPARPNWATSFNEHWQPGENGANIALEQFIEHRVSGYSGNRDIPGITGTSRLSPHLHFGEISPARIWQATQFAAHAEARSAGGGEAFLRELIWREFSHDLLFHHPDMPEQPLRRQFDSFPWQVDPIAMQRWQQGQTGYPIVDAGMRELWSTGWMHNRVRMIAASFLVKHLLQPWQSGLSWFHDTLVDADLANNSASWQWVAGCGADASPWFRIFNPIIQGKKFDPEGYYVRRWVPELEAVANSDLHSPWQMSTPPKHYPPPLVDHGEARLRALDAYKACKGADAKISADRFSAAR